MDYEIKWSDKYSKELKQGYYTCLVLMDEFNYSEQKRQYFNGYDWCWYKSNAQFIHFVDLDSYSKI